MKNRLVLSVAAVLFLGSIAWAGLGSHDAMYVGGTVPNLKEKTEGKPILKPASVVGETDWAQL